MSNNRKKNFFKRPGFRLGIITSSIVVVMAMICLGFWFTTRALFSANDHFILRRVIVKSGGWWKSREREVSEILELSEGKTNLFSLDLQAARLKLEAKPSIAKVAIYKILPDTLAVEITERIPRAFLHGKGNEIVVDSEAVVMTISSCVNVSGDLPVITGFRASPDQLLQGNILEQVKPALKLLDSIKDECSRVAVLRISLNNEKEFNTSIIDLKTGRKYQVLFPRKNLLEKLAALGPVLEAIAAGRAKNTHAIDMRFEGQAVLK